MNREERLSLLQEIDIYPVTCQELSNNRGNLEVLEGVLLGGARIIQLREKKMEKRELYTMALEFKKRISDRKFLLIINDHVDVALAACADGVHLGQEDLPIHAARTIAPDLIIGASSHNMKEALEAEKQGADYVNIGPIFPTKTKDISMDSLGPEAIASIGPKLKVPFTTMGGINPDNIREVLRAGARRVAMVSGITMANHIAERVRDLRRIIMEYHSQQ